MQLIHKMFIAVTCNETKGMIRNTKKTINIYAVIYILFYYTILKYMGWKLYRCGSGE